MINGKQTLDESGFVRSGPGARANNNVFPSLVKYDIKVHHSQGLLVR